MLKLFTARSRGPRRIADIAEELGNYADRTNKPRYIWETYEPYLAPMADLPVSLLELGVWRGVSLKIFASFFRRGRVVGVDLNLPEFDFSAWPNASLERADQRDRTALHAICDRHAPGGFDIIIDDASHIGRFSEASFAHLFERVKRGGLYVIEDWQTGYMPDWQDGAALAPSESAGDDRRFPSHDFGMVGYVKSLVDELG